MQVAANSFGRVCCQGFPRDNYSSSYKFQRKKHTIVSRRKRIIECGIAEPSGQPAPMGQKTHYNDNFFDKIFMALFARKMNNIAGGKSTSKVEGYDRFVETSRSVMQGRTPKQQQEAVRQVLLSMLPPGAPERVVEVEVNGVKQKSGVHIKKCRYLENSGCVGMCVNMCKLPTQDFFTNEFGLPLTMTPNFEDMSCDMVYGQPPPPPEEDPAFKQPCYAAFCSVAQPDSEACPKLLVRERLDMSF